MIRGKSFSTCYTSRDCGGSCLFAPHRKSKPDPTAIRTIQLLSLPPPPLLKKVGTTLTDRSAGTEAAGLVLAVVHGCEGITVFDPDGAYLFSYKNNGTTTATTTTTTTTTTEVVMASDVCLVKSSTSASTSACVSGDITLSIIFGMESGLCVRHLVDISGVYKDTTSSSTNSGSNKYVNSIFDTERTIKCRLVNRTELLCTSTAGIGCIYVYSDHIIIGNSNGDVSIYSTHSNQRLAVVSTHSPISNPSGIVTACTLTSVDFGLLKTYSQRMPLIHNSMCATDMLFLGFESGHVMWTSISQINTTNRDVVLESTLFKKLDSPVVQCKVINSPASDDNSTSSISGAFQYGKVVVIEQAGLMHIFGAVVDVASSATGIKGSYHYLSIPFPINNARLIDERYLVFGTQRLYSIDIDSLSTDSSEVVSSSVLLDRNASYSMHEIVAFDINDQGCGICQSDGCITTWIPEARSTTTNTSSTTSIVDALLHMNADNTTPIRALTLTTKDSPLSEDNCNAVSHNTISTNSNLQQQQSLSSLIATMESLAKRESELKSLIESEDKQSFKLIMLTKLLQSRGRKPTSTSSSTISTAIPDLLDVKVHVYPPRDFLDIHSLRIHIVLSTADIDVVRACHEESISVVVLSMTAASSGDEVCTTVSMPVVFHSETSLRTSASASSSSSSAGDRYSAELSFEIDIDPSRPTPLSVDVYLNKPFIAASSTTTGSITSSSNSNSTATSSMNNPMVGDGRNCLGSDGVAVHLGQGRADILQVLEALSANGNSASLQSRTSSGSTNSSTTTATSAPSSVLTVHVPTRSDGIDRQASLPEVCQRVLNVSSRLSSHSASQDPSSSSSSSSSLESFSFGEAMATAMPSAPTAASSSIVTMSATAASGTREPMLAAKLTRTQPTASSTASSHTTTTSTTAAGGHIVHASTSALDGPHDVLQLSGRSRAALTDASAELLTSFINSDSSGGALKDPSGHTSNRTTTAHSSNSTSSNSTSSNSTSITTSTSMTPSGASLGMQRPRLNQYCLPADLIQVVSQLSMCAGEINEVAQRADMNSTSSTYGTSSSTNSTSNSVSRLMNTNSGDGNSCTTTLNEEFLVQHLEALWYLYCKMREKL